MRIWPVELHGRFVRLTPMTLDDVDGLIAAAAEDRATYGFTSVPDGRDAMVEQVESLVRQRDRGHEVPFTTRDATDGRVLGPTGTWLAASAQRSPINTEAKLLMLTHAFETWGVQRVDLKTDARNERSRNAIERIGGKLDGVMRAWQPSLVPGEEGTPRDSALYSILPSEWPEVRAALEVRLTR